MSPITTHRQRLAGLFRLPSLPRIPFMPSVGLPTACAAMGALVLALVIWRVDVVRLLPQTATFYKMVGLEVNLRGLMFKDVKITTETVEGKQVLVIEGVIIGEARKPVELPRLRFSVRDAQGAEIYAWNAVLEQTGAEAGRTRLVQVAAGLAAAGRAQYRHTLLQQTGYGRRQRMNAGRLVSLSRDGMRHAARADRRRRRFHAHPGGARHRHGRPRDRHRAKTAPKRWRS